MDIGAGSFILVEITTQLKTAAVVYHVQKSKVCFIREEPSFSGGIQLP